ncbi:hypothetical protein CVT26_003477 [Gymnopilus dilepis]|uniref:REJ domain-containing protein n=1 Tax=Gymnopilus dilepis TaxID=231916 RepID=A0A409W2U4_9AGAR|nr:hypothetical protein CVT26_003477 [Gymnopilus dilepis]
MSPRTLVYTTLLLVPMCQAAVVTLYTPAVAGPTPASYLHPPIFESNSIVSVSAVDVLPGNITEYAVGKAYTETIQEGSGTGSNGFPASLRTTFWTSTNTFQEGASFVGNSFSVDVVIQTTTFIPITAAAGCTLTAPPSASEASYRCAEVQVLNGTSTTTIFYTASARPAYTLTEATPPPTASVNTGVIFPSGVPTASKAEKISIALGWLSVIPALNLFFVNL